MSIKLLLFCCVALLTTQLASSNKIKIENEKNTITQQLQLESQETIKDVEAIMENTLTEIQNIENKAGQLSAEALECVLKEKEALKELTIKTYKALKHCLHTSIQNAQGLIESAKQKIEEIRTIVGELHIEITECTTLTCIKEVLKKLAEKVPEIIHLIEEIARETVEFLQEEIPKYRACKNVAYENYKTELHVIVLRIKECIDGL